MSDDIQFGDVHERSPDPMLAPSRDDHYATVRIGAQAENELAIFVDLDVFHELENHAVSNTQVELGGVLLGRQAVDGHGRPMVVVTDSLRAEHYEATRGSFKFTHSTWSEITRRRARMNESLGIVGWYHTHPGWGVFLSGMDDFICQNFFNGPLDVALVIDPCQGTRGWFQWDADRKQTQLCAGFWLMAVRHRRMELEAMARQLNGPGPDEFRDSAGTLTAPFIGEGDLQMHRGSPSPPPLRGLSPGLLLTGWMMGLQTIVLALIGWKILAMPAAESQSVPEASQLRLETENRIYRDLASSMATGSGAESGLVERLAELESRQIEESAAILSHIDRIKTLESELVSLREENRRFQQENGQLQTALQKSESRVASLAPDSGPGESQGESVAGPPAWWQGGYTTGILITAMALLLACGAGAVWFASGRSRRYGASANEEFHQMDFELKRPAASLTDEEVSGTDTGNFADLSGRSQLGQPSGE